MTEAPAANAAWAMTARIQAWTLPSSLVLLARGWVREIALRLPAALVRSQSLRQPISRRLRISPASGALARRPRLLFALFHQTPKAHDKTTGAEAQDAPLQTAQIFAAEGPCGSLQHGRQEIITNLLVRYEAASQTALEPVRARSLQRLDALLKTSAGKDLQIVTQIAKSREDIQTNGFQVPSTNLLKNPTFGQKFKGWEVQSYQNAGRAVTDDAQRFSGKPALRIENPVEGDTMILQKVAVNPQTRYRLSAMVKTQDVVRKNGGKGGASLAIRGGWESSQPVSQTQDWLPVIFEFDTGLRTEVEIGPRLGFTATNTMGTAWFADLSLIELQPQQAPAAAPNGK